MSNRELPGTGAKEWYGRVLLRAQQQREREAAQEALRQSEDAAVYQRAALAVGAAQLQTAAREQASAALATPSEKPDIVTGVQAKRKRVTAAIRI